MHLVTTQNSNPFRFKWNLIRSIRNTPRVFLFSPINIEVPFSLLASQILSGAMQRILETKIFSHHLYFCLSRNHLSLSLSLISLSISLCRTTACTTKEAVGHRSRATSRVGVLGCCLLWFLVLEFYQIYFQVRWFEDSFPNDYVYCLMWELGFGWTFLLIRLVDHNACQVVRCMYHIE